MPRTSVIGGESAQTWVWESLLYLEVAYIFVVYPQIFPAIDTKLFYVYLRSEEGYESDQHPGIVLNHA